jgi:hypothetical protein
MRALIRKLHMYAGLFSFTALMVYGVAGLEGTASRPPGQSEPQSPAVEFLEYKPPAGAGDKAVADSVHALLKPPLAGPIPEWAVHRNAAHDLELDFYSPNGMTRAVVLEKEGRLRIERRRVRVWGFLNDLHAMTPGEYQQDIRLKLWSWYNEAAMWSLMGMVFSGVYLWLASRPGWRTAQLTFAAGSMALMVLYFSVR